MSTLLLMFFSSSCIRTNYLLTHNDVTIYKHSGDTGGFMSSSGGGTAGAYSSRSSISNAIRPIYISKEAIEELGIMNLDAFILHCNTNKLKQAYSVLALNTKADPSAINYLEGVILLMSAKNIESIEVLKKCTSPLLEIEVKLLLIDNKFEINNRNGYINVGEFVGKYQEILDQHNLDSEYIDVIDSRIKYLRYQ